MKTAKNISIKSYLAQRGVVPKLERIDYGMYLSPFRAERTPSFKVDYNKNLWYDFGVGEGGSIIDLVMQIEGCSLAEAFKRLEDGQWDQIVQPTTMSNKSQSTQTITEIKELTHPKLLSYLRSRKIDLRAAKEYCQEVHYEQNGKQYFAIGFRNDMDGYELRNKYYKGGTSPKAPTSFYVGSSETTIFEGFMDFLSYKTLDITPDKVQNIIILNSVSNLNKVIDKLANQRVINSFLDNDTAGKKALAELQKLDVEVIDRSAVYHEFKDMNEYLIALSKEPTLQLRVNMFFRVASLCCRTTKTWSTALIARAARIPMVKLKNYNHEYKK